MKHHLLRKAEYYWYTIKNHLYSKWYKLFLGHVGRGTVIRRHCQLEGDSLENVTIGDLCLIDTNCVIGCRSLLKRNEIEIKPELRIGNNCNLGQYNHISAVNRITIGNNLLTGRFVLITDNSHGHFNYDELNVHPSERQVVSKGEIVIGNNVWIGDKVSILSGVHIGDGCIVGANSVVLHDIPPYSMAAGIPAVVIRKISN